MSKPFKRTPYGEHDLWGAPWQVEDHEPVTARLYREAEHRRNGLPEYGGYVHNPGDSEAEAARARVELVRERLAALHGYINFPRGERDR